MKIQASIVGYHGEAVCVQSFWHEATRLLIIKQAAQYTEDRLDGCAIVANSDVPGRDARFGEDVLAEAIEAFFVLNSQGQLVFEDGLDRVNPMNAIESDAITVNGKSYRLMPEISNGQVAVLATAWYAGKGRSIERALSFGDELFSLSVGDILTI